MTSTFAPPAVPFPWDTAAAATTPAATTGGARASTSRNDDNARKTVSYGNDMMPSCTGDEMKLDRHFHDGERQIPARWTDFRHGGPGFEYKHDDESHEMERVRPHRHHRRHHHHDEDENENEEPPRRAADLERRELIGFSSLSNSVSHPLRFAVAARSRKVAPALSGNESAPKSFDYDLLIIGAGVDGHDAALHAVE